MYTSLSSWKSRAMVNVMRLTTSTRTRRRETRIFIRIGNLSLLSMASSSLS